jgi:DNA repair photolyase
MATENSNTTQTFDAARKGTGTHEWAERTENIARGCPHNCLYCYAAQNAKRFKLRDRADWPREELTARANLTSYPARDGVIMFPSAHDITPFNVEAYLRVAKLMLAKGNKLLIVSKPHYAVIARLCTELSAYKALILFRFTIGTIDEATALHWEPGAPTPDERIKALALAHSNGYRTSVSAEPLLGGLATAQTLEAVRPYVTDTVWIGKMNKIRARVDMADPAAASRAQDIERAQTDGHILALVDSLGDDELVRWKDSVLEVIARRQSSAPQ